MLLWARYSEQRDIPSTDTVFISVTVQGMPQRDFISIKQPLS
uniref:Uncharacterized protein n=1 Tax=Anguilla anguilla TaxID=7936 RepID=A0A0E9S422_ANGAN